MDEVRVVQHRVQLDTAVTEDTERKMDKRANLVSASGLKISALRWLLRYSGET